MKRQYVHVGLFLVACIAPQAGRAQEASPGAVGIRIPERPGDPWRPTPPQPEGRGAGEVVFEVGPYRSIQVNTDAEGLNVVGDAANEPSLAVDPFAPDRMAIGWRQFDTIESNFRQAGWAYSGNGGRTWTSPGVLEPEVFRSDPVLAADAGGNFYYASLALVDPDGPNGDVFIDVWKSNDGGQSWNPPAFAFGGDKEWIVVDRTGGEGDGNIYHSYGSIGSPFQPTLFARSSDGGASFEDPLPIQPGVAYGTLAVAPDGTLHIVGTPDDGQGGFDFTYRVATSRDASISANPTFQVQDIDMGGTCPFLGFVNPAGGLGQPWIATDPQNSDVIYVLASVDPGEGPTDLNFIRSVDGGATWTSPRKITDEPEGPLSFQWFGTLSVAPNGRLDAVWNDTRNDPENPEPMFSELFYSFSEDGGDTWSPNVAVSPAYNHFLGYPRQNKLGDYYHTISDDLGVHVAYAATFNGEQDVYYLRIGSYDCNQNGVADEQDLSEGTSVDGNGDGIPDECAAAAARANLVADFTAAPEGDTEPLEVAFDASLTTTDVAHKVVSYRWDFGDGSTAEGVVANHTYETFGLYDVRLRVEDDLGRRAVTGGGVVVEFRGEDVAPWASDVVGEVEGTVGARFEEECLLFSGPSGALEGRSDKAHFVHQPMAGNFRFTARLTEWAGAEPDSVVGLTVRASREDNARHGTVALRRLEDAFQHRFVRRQTLFTRFVDNKVYESLGLWLRIDRRGGMVSGQLSVDGETWTEPDSVELEGLPEEVHVGLVLASSEDVPSAATFCDLSFEELPDEVGLQILRGDCDDNGDVDISDGRCILDWRFSGSPAPGCLAATNINGDGQTNIADAIYLFSSLFLGGPPPVPPFPGCGALTEDDAAFGCETPPAGCAL